MLVGGGGTWSAARLLGRARRGDPGRGCCSPTTSPRPGTSSTRATSTSTSSRRTATRPSATTPTGRIEDPRYLPQNLGIMFLSTPGDPARPRCPTRSARRRPAVHRARRGARPVRPRLPARRAARHRDEHPADEPGLPARRPGAAPLGRSRLVAGAALAGRADRVVNLMHFSQGWVQFGYRFSNDFVAFALPLVALGHGAPARRRGPMPLAFGLIVGVGRDQPVGRRSGATSSDGERAARRPWRVGRARSAVGARRRSSLDAWSGADARRRVLGHRRVPDRAPDHGHGPPDRLSRPTCSSACSRNVLLDPDRRAGVPDEPVLSALAVAVAAARHGRPRPAADRLDDLGVAAGLGLALTPVVWSNATRADPHPLHLAFVALLLLALVALGATRASAERRGGAATPPADRCARRGRGPVRPGGRQPLADAAARARRSRLYVLAVEPGDLAPAAARRSPASRPSLVDRGARLPRAAAPGRARSARRSSTASRRPGTASGTSPSPSSSAAPSATRSPTWPASSATLVELDRRRSSARSPLLVPLAFVVAPSGRRATRC